MRDPSEVIYQPGDKVYFKRNDDIKWKGPAKVLANEGKVGFLRYGSQLIRVSSCRIRKMGDEWRQNDLETSQHSSRNSDVHSEFSVSYPELSGENSYYTLIKVTYAKQTSLMK